MSAVVIAFDGVLAESLDLRAGAIVEALVEVGATADFATVRQALPGRSLAEVVALVMRTPDTTLADIATMRAQRSLTAQFAHGVGFRADAAEWLDAQRASGARLVLRADSARRDVERALQFADFASMFTFVRCADDLPRDAALSSLANAYAHIVQRLARLPSTQPCRAIEVSDYATQVAEQYLGRRTGGD